MKVQIERSYNLRRMEWRRDSWRKYPIFQQPEYTGGKIDPILNELKNSEGIVRWKRSIPCLICNKPTSASVFDKRDFILGSSSFYI